VADTSITPDVNAPQTEDLVTPDLQPKTLFAGDDWTGQPYLLVTADSIQVAGSLDNGIVIDPQFGTLLQGPIHFSAAPEDISFGAGYWRLNPMVTTCIGSSAAVPVPMLVEDSPDLLHACSDISGILDSLG
jgi:hypothetical protein